MQTYNEHCQLILRCSQWSALSDAVWLHTEATGRRRCAQLSDRLLSFSQLAAESRRDAGSGRVWRREGRELLLRSGRVLHASPDHPETDVVGKPPLQRVVWYQWTGLPSCTPSTPCLSLFHSHYLCLSLFVSFIQSGLLYISRLFVLNCSILLLLNFCCAVHFSSINRNHLSDAASGDSGPASNYHMFIWGLFCVWIELMWALWI